MWLYICLISKLGMVKHVVLFKFKADLDAGTKAKVAESFKSAIEALPSKISFLKHVEVGVNINEQEKFDVALYSELATLDDVRAYAVHPDHLAASGIIRPHVEARACVDYEI